MKRRTARVQRMAAALALAAAVCSTQAMAVEPAPVERSGSTCPSGYRSSGAYCVPRKDDTKAAMPRAGSSCPSGYRSSGAYCVARKADTPPAIQRVGNTCPSGYRSSGSYCVKRD